MDKKKSRILYLQTTPVPPPRAPQMDRFVLLSDDLRGDVLHPLWFSNGEECEAKIGPETFPSWKRGDFRYHWFLWTVTGLRLKFRTLRFYLREGLRRHREDPFDCIVAYSHMTTALCAMLLCWLTGARLIVEVVSSPDRVFLFDRPRPTLGDRAFKYYSDLCLHITLLFCSRVHLLYSSQLDSYPLLKNVRRCVFHEFIAVGAIPYRVPQPDPVILFVGGPWYLKGVDLLIAAFRRLAPDYPNVKLRLVGHFTDLDGLRALIGDAPRIEVLPSRPNEEVLPIIANASMLVLPSRCEGMGRVLLEAMAAGIPVVGSNVGGIPSLIVDGENGFLFPEDDSHALEACLRKLLDEPALRNRLGDRGHALATTNFSEQSYVRHFTEMVEQAKAQA